MLPQATASRPAARRIAASIPVVVVLPLVPVTASHTGGRSMPWPSHHASSGSPTSGTPAAAAAATSGWSGRRPGEVTTRSVPAGTASGSPPASAPGGRSARAAGRASVTVTRAPASTSAAAAASPDTPAPATSTRAPDSSSGLIVGSPSRASSPMQPCSSGGPATARRGQPLLVEQPEPERGAHGRQQPEPDDHRGLGPPGELEVVVERRHPEHAAPGGAEHRDLHGHRQHLHHEHAADHHEQQL